MQPRKTSSTTGISMSLVRAEKPEELMNEIHSLFEKNDEDFINEIRLLLKKRKPSSESKALIIHPTDSVIETELKKNHFEADRLTNAASFFEGIGISAASLGPLLSLAEAVGLESPYAEIAAGILSIMLTLCNVYCHRIEHQMGQDPAIEGISNAAAGEAHVSTSGWLAMIGHVLSDITETAGQYAAGAKTLKLGSLAPTLKLDSLAPMITGAIGGIFVSLASARDTRTALKRYNALNQEEQKQPSCLSRAWQRLFGSPSKSTPDSLQHLSEGLLGNDQKLSIN